MYKTLEAAINNADKDDDMYTFVSEYKINSNKIVVGILFLKIWSDIYIRYTYFF